MKSYLVAIAMLLGFGFAIPLSHAQENTNSISIPSIDVNALIVEAPLSPELQTWDVSHLNMNVGHMEYTGWFGQQANIVLAGHSENTNGQADVFYRLDEVEVGDEITVQADGNTYRYIVTRLALVEYTDISILNPTSVETLTIITCDIASYTGGFNYTKRHVVIAERVS